MLKLRKIPHLRSLGVKGNPVLRQLALSPDLIAFLLGLEVDVPVLGGEGQELFERAVRVEGERRLYEVHLRRL